MMPLVELVGQSIKKKSQIYKRNEKVEETSATIWKCMQDKIDKHIQAGHVLDE